MEGSFRKPESRLMKPKAPPPSDSQESELANENAEFLADKVRLEAEAKAKEDKVGALIGGKWFITEWTDPILWHPVVKVQMTVHRFYPQINVALDIFTHIGSWEESIIALKRKAFKENEITYGGQKIKAKYAALDYSMPLAEILPQLED